MSELWFWNLSSKLFSWSCIIQRILSLKLKNLFIDIPEGTPTVACLLDIWKSALSKYRKDKCTNCSRIIPQFMWHVWENSCALQLISILGLTKTMQFDKAIHFASSYTQTRFVLKLLCRRQKRKYWVQTCDEVWPLRKFSAYSQNFSNFSFSKTT